MSDNLDRALALCRGSYQRYLVCGKRTVGQSDLRGKAKQSWGSYHASAQSILGRLRDNNIPYRLIPGPRGGKGSATIEILNDDGSPCDADQEALDG